MADYVPITALDHPDLRLYRSLKGKPFPFADTFFLAESEKLVRRLLESSFWIESILLTPEWLESLRPLIESRREPINVFVADEALLQTITGIEMHQCVMAVAHVPERIEPAPFITSLASPKLIVALDGIVDAENMGGIVRNCAAFGVQLLIIDKTCCSPFLRRAVRVSMGGIFRVPIAFVDDLAATLRDFRDVRIVAAHVDRSNQTLSSSSFDGDLCLVFGNEGAGISSRVLDACAERVYIPMHEGFDSLNVASANAVFLHEACKQRSSE